ncbi:hypothetical protein U8P76_25225 (plasmid) [Rhizobium johnstonii]|nr:hypothetical protein U8P76_25225 [Rhizobium johnstonii]
MTPMRLKSGTSRPLSADSTIDQISVTTDTENTLDMKNTDRSTPLSRPCPNTARASTRASAVMVGTVMATKASVLPTVFQKIVSNHISS